MCNCEWCGEAIEGPLAQLGGHMMHPECLDDYNAEMAADDERFDEPTDEDVEWDDSMDGDFDSGMASAGYGTDEDYGYYGGDEDY